MEFVPVSLRGYQGVNVEVLILSYSTVESNPNEQSKKQ